VIIFIFSLVSATHLMGFREAVTLLAIAMVIGWFAEEMGDSRGWFFGKYTYTAVLGPTLSRVPVVIPLLWFSLVYMGYVIANLIVWRAPIDASVRLRDMAWMSLLTAFIVTAYDLGADPYLVYVEKAWIMEKTDGWWFGETVQGFFGWVLVAFTITLTFRLIVRVIPPRPVVTFTRRHALLPVLAYFGFAMFQVFKGHPPETRSIAVFAMGIPILAALAGWTHWKEMATTTHGDSR
jgi:putative membrane protein